MGRDLKNAADEFERRRALIRMAADLKNVSRACKILGYSRDTYYRISKSGGTVGSPGSKVRSSEGASTQALKRRCEIESMILYIANENPTPTFND